MVKRVKLGDVFPIVTTNGVTYAQVTHKNDQYGHLIRVFPLIHYEGLRPPSKVDIPSIVAGEPQFSTFFPIQTALNRHYFSIISNEKISKQNAKFPMFKCVDRNISDKVSYFWDGENTIKKNRPFKKKETKFPQRQIMNAATLVYLSGTNYRAEDEPYDYPVDDFAK